MAASSLSDQDWRIRLHVYRVFAERGQPPSHEETAESLAISPHMVRRAYQRLHRGHALFLESATSRIRMANPLSAIPTSYRVLVDGRLLWANCAWDSLGIPAMLRADAHIETAFAHSREPTTYAVEAGVLRADGGVVHFPLPFRLWYDDLIHT